MAASSDLSRNTISCWVCCECISAYRQSLSQQEECQNGLGQSDTLEHQLSEFEPSECISSADKTELTRVCEDTRKPTGNGGSCYPRDDHHNISNNQSVIAAALPSMSSDPLDHLIRVLNYHPQYLELFAETHRYLLYGNGPLPYDYRHYIAIMAASRHNCSYLVQAESSLLMAQGGNESWLNGLEYATRKLSNLSEFNKILAHRPWLITSSHITTLLEGKSEEEEGDDAAALPEKSSRVGSGVHHADRWSLPELTHALILLAHFHALASFVHACGISSFYPMPALPRNPPEELRNISSHDGTERGDIGESVVRDLGCGNGRAAGVPGKCAGGGGCVVGESTDTAAGVLCVGRGERCGEREIILPSGSEIQGGHVCTLGVEEMRANLAKEVNVPGGEVILMMVEREGNVITDEGLVEVRETSGGVVVEREEENAVTRIEGEGEGEEIGITRIEEREGIDLLGIDALLDRMRELSGELECGLIQEMSLEELAKRFEQVQQLTVELATSVERPAGNRVHSLDVNGLHRYITDPEFSYLDFCKQQQSLRNPNNNNVTQKDSHKTFVVEDFSWEDHGYSLASRLYNEIGILLDDKFTLAQRLTYNTCGTKVDVDTSPFRRAVWNYVHCLYGLRHGDYDYSAIGQLLEKKLRAYIRLVACYPASVTREDYDSFMTEFLQSEKVHINIMIFEARLQAELLYGLRAISRYMTERRT